MTRKQDIEREIEELKAQLHALPSTRASAARGIIARFVQDAELIEYRIEALKARRRVIEVAQQGLALNRAAVEALASDTTPALDETRRCLALNTLSQALWAYEEQLVYSRSCGDLSEEEADRALANIAAASKWLQGKEGE